ncbi:MAG: cadherin-like domain-containing protein, partial [Roseiflexaceae bacterium]
PPAIQAYINRGQHTGLSAEATTSNRVRLSLSTNSGDPAVMWRWSEDGTTFSPWIALTSRYDITFTDSDGYKEIRIEARDRVGNVATTFAGIIVNRTNGSTYAVSINNGDEFTNVDTVNLAMNVPSSTFPPIAEMQISSSGSFESSAWEPFALGRAWQFMDTSTSIYRIYVRYRNVDGAITQIVSDDILIDRSAPFASLSVRTSNGQAQVTIKGTDRPTTASYGSGIVSMQIAPANEFSNSTWQTFATNTQLRTTSTTIYARFRDKAGNVSTVSCITITSQQCTPEQSIIANTAPSVSILKPYRLGSNGYVILDALTIMSSDRETSPNQLVYILQAEPVNGWMLFNGQRMSNGTRFTLADLQRKRIVYRQNGSSNEHDRIIIQVSDGSLSSEASTVWFLLDGVADPEPTATLPATATATLVQT